MQTHAGRYAAAAGVEVCTAAAHGRQATTGAAAQAAYAGALAAAVGASASTADLQLGPRSVVTAAGLHTSIASA